FFQAEDGIRDFHVTGVQTCALPISLCACQSAKFPRFPSRGHAGRVAAMNASDRTDEMPPPTGGHWVDVGAVDDFAEGALREVRRSEERRVGKGCRSRAWQHRESNQS